MLKHTFSVIAISEMWETATNTNLLQIMGHTIVSHHRKIGKGEGVTPYVENSINFKPRRDLDDTGLNSFESIFIEITNRKKQRMVIGTIYTELRIMILTSLMSRLTCC